ncbi:hypothetical protein chiPu_0005109 [Chiloscyllium punctatum]|uniref:Uncharacterized protein n=1 Tax=Chiloscyllium punctatum TaxID=137246 RepID=A0A401S8H6_CHIPU|nr:hypothetical protein [Chiloscyllium punctatum]
MQLGSAASHAKMEYPGRKLTALVQAEIDKNIRDLICQISSTLELSHQIKTKDSVVKTNQIGTRTEM